MEVRIRRRKSTETLSALHQDIRRLMALAHPDIPSSSREVIACDYFIDSLGEPDFALKVRERNPVSLDDALRISLQLEAWARDANRQKDEEGSRMRAKPVRAVTSESSNNAALEARVNMVSQQLNEVLQYLSNPSSSHQVDNSVSQFPMQNGPSTPHWNSNTEPKRRRPKTATHHQRDVFDVVILTIISVNAHLMEHLIRQLIMQES
jgi:hypothetical protein